MTTRRGLLQGMGAISVAMPLVDASGALAQGNPGATRGQSDLVFIAGKDVEAVPMAEWEARAAGADAGAAPLRVAVGAAVSKAPANASRYTAKTYNFPSGSIRVLHWKKGEGPVIHQIGFETEIFVAQGSLTLTPLFAVKGPTADLGSGDALFMPQGTLRNMNPAEDTILVTFMVEGGKNGAKASIVHAKDAVSAETAQWQEGGKGMTATKPDELAKAPANAVRWSSKRYMFDGNSMRLASFTKAGRSNTGTTGRGDVLIYIVKGSLGRKEGDHMLELTAGDALREKLGNPGYWEAREGGVFLATDAPVNPGRFAPTMAG